MGKCVYASIDDCEGDLFPTNVGDNVICDKHRRRFSHASWEYVEGLEKEIKFLDGCRKALESLTPGGSEYFRDPERCVSTVRERFKSGHEAKKELTKLRKARR